MLQPPTYVIRDAQPAERDALVALASAVTIAPSGLSPQWQVASWEWCSSILPALPVIYRRHNQRASAQHWPEMRLLAVDPHLRGQGIGRALVTECLRRACRSGAQRIGLHTMESMMVAQRLYEQLGFTHTPETDFTPVEGVIVKGYRLDLAQHTACNDDHHVSEGQ